MQKYNEFIFDKQSVSRSLKIRLWEKVLLMFIPARVIENEETVSRFKYLFGKHYLVDFKLK